MKNYEKMIALNHAQSTEKVKQAIQAIQMIVLENGELTVKELQKRTGLSRGFFYKNERVRTTLEEARKQRNYTPAVRPQQIILDQAMEQQLKILKRQLKRLLMENQQLKTENKQWRELANKEEGI